MKEKETKRIKGIAILFMLFYHLFSNQSRLARFQVTGIIGGIETMKVITSAAHACVGLFVFCTAYGLTVGNKGRLHDIKDCFKSALKRYIRFIKKVCYVFLMLLLCSYIFGCSYNATTVWGELQMERVIGIICNALGIAGIFRVPWFSASWWYITLEVLFLFLVPLCHILVKKVGPWAAFFLTLYGVHLCGLNTNMDGLPRYVLIVILGIIFAEYAVFEKIDEYLRNKTGLRIFLSVAIVALLPVAAVMKSHVQSTYLMDALLTIMIVLLTQSFIRAIPVVNCVLVSLGNYSMYMWLIHPFFTVHWAQKFIYSFHNMWLIFLVLIVCSFTVSFLFDKLKHIFECSVFKKWYESKYGLIVLACLTVGFCYMIACVSSNMAYLSNDDAGIQNLLAGNVTGTPYMTHQYINFILGIIISYMYKIAPKVQWWYVYSLFIMAVGIFLIHFCILWIGRKRNAELRIPMLVIGILDVAYIVYPVANVSFSIVPAILGTGVVSICFILNDFGKWKKHIRIFIVFGYALALMHRRDSGLALLCYILLAILYYVWNTEKKLLTIVKKFSVYCLFFLVFTVGIIGTNSAANKKINGTYFTNFNQARADYMDKPHDSYYDNRMLYEEVGWDEEIYRLVSGWCFIDETVTAENFRHITKNSNIKTDLLNRSKNIIVSVLQDTRCQAMILLNFFSVFYVVYLFLVRFEMKDCIFFILNNAGSMILLLYQLFRGRMIYRSMMVVFLPMFVINCLFILRNDCRKESEKVFSNFVIFFAGLFCSSVVLDYVFDPVRNAYKEWLINNSAGIEEYVMDHPENIYICTSSAYNTINPWTIYTDAHPTNLIPYGGASYHSDNYKKRLKLNGIETLSGLVFQKTNVYYACSENVLQAETFDVVASSMANFYRYLQKKYHVIGFTFEESVNEVYLYRFVFEENKECFSSYYCISEGNMIEIQNEKDIK